MYLDIRVFLHYIMNSASNKFLYSHLEHGLMNFMSSLSNFLFFGTAAQHLINNMKNKL